MSVLTFLLLSSKLIASTKIATGENYTPSWPTVVRYWECSFCACRETRKRRTPPLGERVHALPQSGHSTSVTPLSSKCLREIRTTPENVHLSDVAGGASAFFRDRAPGACSVGAEDGIFCSSSF